MNRTRNRFHVAAVTLLIGASTRSQAKVFVTHEVAVREAFPGVATEHRTDFLTGDQAARIESAAGTAPSSRIVLSWQAVKDGRLVGTACL